MRRYSYVEPGTGGTHGNLHSCNYLVRSAAVRAIVEAGTSYRLFRLCPPIGTRNRPQVALLSSVYRCSGCSGEESAAHDSCGVLA